MDGAKGSLRYSNVRANRRKRGQVGERGDCVEGFRV